MSSTNFSVRVRNDKLQKWASILAKFDGRPSAALDYLIDKNADEGVTKETETKAPVTLGGSPEVGALDRNFDYNSGGSSETRISSSEPHRPHSEAEHTASEQRHDSGNISRTIQTGSSLLGRLVKGGK